MKGRRAFLILTFLLLTAISGCNGCSLISPSHQATEDYKPVFAAATGGDLPAVQAAIEKDPALVKATEWDNATLLHDAVQQNHQDVAEYLLGKGADPNVTTTDGLTPLHMAAQNGNVAIAKLLLDRGAKVDAVDSKRWTPLDRAVKWGHPEAADFLKQRGGHEGRSAG